MDMRKLMRIVENADFDKNNMSTKPTSFGNKEASDKGRADVKMRNVGKYADNALVEDEVSTLDKLHAMLNKAGISDDEIKAGISLTDQGKQTVAGKLGTSASEVDMLIASLVTSMKKEDDHVAAVYETFINEEDGDRYSYEKDALGNVTVRDSQTGKQTFLQGSEASQLLSKLNGGDIQGVLSGYQSMMESVDDSESDSYMDEINNPVGSFNFTWKVDGKNGFGNASYSGTAESPKFKLVRVTDVEGNEIQPDDALKAKILKCAIDYSKEV